MEQSPACKIKSCSSSLKAYSTWRTPVLPGGLLGKPAIVRSSDLLWLLLNTQHCYEYARCRLSGYALASAVGSWCDSKSWMAASNCELFACSFFFLSFSTKWFKTLAVVRLYRAVFFRFSSVEFAFLWLGCFSAQAGSFMVIWKKVECRSTEILLLIFSCVLAMIVYVDGCIEFVG